MPSPAAANSMNAGSPVTRLPCCVSAPLLPPAVSSGSLDAFDDRTVTVYVGAVPLASPSSSSTPFSR